MKLKSIHISGFKSFADRVNIQYHAGITGVIGPNGSGKSNIIDAVRWVMGERNAESLRADDATDVIFAGSQNRKPLSLAEVTLVFANDGSHCPPEFVHLPEISIARRITRGGDREYFMNREPCRLKDIVDFLMSIGLGSKSYAIIQQEKRDRIIQASPEVLREILEEAAGITIFKVRRKEAEKRLESTNEKMKNLAEIENEYVRQKETLSEQVEKATQKLAYQQELKEQEISLIKNHVGFYRGITAKIKKEIETTTLDIQKTSVETGEWEARANDLKTLQLEHIQSIKSTENLLDDQRISLTKYLERTENQKQRHTEYQMQNERLIKETTEERSNLKREEDRQVQLLNDLQQAENNLQKIEGEQETLQEQLDEMNEILQVKRNQSEEMRIEMRAIETTRSSLRSRNEFLLDTLTKYNQQLQKVSENHQTDLELRAQIAADRLAVAESLNKISAGLDEILKTRNDMMAELDTVQTLYTNAQDERDKAKEKHLEVATHIASLQKLIDSNSGLGDGALALKEKLSSKIAGFLFDVVSLHKDDEIILERSMPDLLQAAIVENVDNFVEIIDKVEEFSISKVFFLVKDLISPLSANEIQAKNNLTTLYGVRCTGDRLEKCSSSAAKNVFERIFICEDEWIMFKAKKLCSNTSFIFVTERGTVSHSLNELSCGLPSGGISVGLMQRKREYEENCTQKEKLQELLAGAEGGLYLLQEKKRKIEEKTGELSAHLEKEKVESLKISNQLENFDLKLRHSDEILSRLENEQKKLNQEIGENKEAFATNQNQLDKLDGEYLSLQKDLDDFELEFSDKKEMHAELLTQVQNKKSEKALIQERQMSGRRHYEETSFQVKRMQQKVDSLLLQIDDLKNKIAQADNESQSLAAEVDGFRKQIHILEEKLQFFSAQEEETAEELRLIERKLKTHKDTAATKQKFITDKQLDLARFDTILETALKDAFDKYHLTVNDLPTEAENNSNLSNKLEERIKELQALISELGPVNERAIEEFKDISERLNFLVLQKQDIERSVEELRLSIQEIEENTKLRFKEIFDKINAEFQKIFPVLFPGGDAKLHMLNELDLLTTGVEILVKLPGKRMQNMSLFSGGEKALTAISLIFSLLKTTPAPFCFLDEVDAPLDEANVGRFNDVLEALSSEFQFVVITHNRRTMEVLDTIYGISMSEPGVSKLVSVDLTDVPAHLRKKQKTMIKGNTEADRMVLN